ncbi:MAG TPA: LuxR C-terminal-related transcriptional regulator [Candidatus Dormibacteraeota bacterium]
MISRARLEVIADRIIRLCGSGLDRRSLVREVMAEIRRVVPCEGWCIATIDPATLMLTSSIGEGFAPQTSGRFLQLEYSEPDFNKFADLARRTPSVGLLGEATGGDMHRSARWREINQPAGLNDELRAALVVDGACWGALDLLRRTESGSFSQAEAKWIAGLTETIAAGLRAALVLDAPVVEDTVAGPGLVILSDDLEPIAMSTTARAWLHELKLLESEWMGPMPNVVYAVVARLRELEGSEVALPQLMPRGRVQLPNGRWIAVQASRLTTAGGRRQVAVIIEPPDGAELAPLIVSAYSLTDREAQIAQLTLRGLSTKEIAQDLGISPLTVQQHLKVVFTKVGVHSRGELIGKVFEQQYWPRLKAGQGIGPDGWFAAPN